MHVLGRDVARGAARHPRARRVRAGKRRAHSRDECGLVRRVLRRAGRTAARRCRSARARGAVLRRPRRSPLPERRNVLDRHEAADQAGAGAGPRSRSAVPRRAHQRDGSQRARRDARARPRSRPQQGRQSDPVVPSSARRRIRLRSRDRHRQGGRGRCRSDRGTQAAARTGVRAAREAPGRRPRGVPRAAGGRRAANVTRPTTTSCACSCPGEGGARDVFAIAASAGAQVRHLRQSVPTLEDVFAQAVGED